MVSTNALLASAASVVFVELVAYPLGLNHVATTALALQWLAFIPAYRSKTEKYYDITGTITFLVCTLMSLSQSDQHPRQKILSLLVFAWTMRLGLYLFNRIMITGKDKRFDEVKGNPALFFQYWTVQGVWVFITSLPVHVVNVKKGTGEWAFPTGFDIAGVLVWMLGFGIEILADHQKFQFQHDYETRENWINVGLWAWSRHPNYAGEIILWVGVLLIASPSLTTAADWLSLLSPIFVSALLGKVSVPMTEKGASKRWGGEAAYQEYIRNTPAIFPFIHFWP